MPTLPLYDDKSMGRAHKDVVVIVAWSASGATVGEDIVPHTSFESAGSILLNSPDYRRAAGIRGLSVRVFDELGRRLYVKSFAFDEKGEPVNAIYRRPDGSIIESPERYL